VRRRVGKNIATCSSGFGFDFDFEYGFCANKPEANPKCNCFEPQLSRAFTC